MMEIFTLFLPMSNCEAEYNCGLSLELYVVMSISGYDLHAHILLLKHQVQKGMRCRNYSLCVFLSNYFSSHESEIMR
jgi:hypothetical protein